ncbi:MAG TPA: twin transmembrane helix small protein [Gammaproteobacteria bacterium]|nr:twin transmembrane helix small protein [Gammaproteobacteria bacterium]
MYLLIVVLFAAIVASLGSALFSLLRPKNDPKRMLNALTLRVGLSVLLFVLLLIAWRAGLIAPHGVLPPGAH